MFQQRNNLPSTNLPSFELSLYRLYFCLVSSQISNTRLYLAVFSAVLGNFNFGYSLVYSSPVLPKFKSPDVDPRLRMDTEQAAWFGSIYSLGAAAGGLGAMLLNDMIGRKLSIMMSAVPSTLGWVSQQTHILIKQNMEKVGNEMCICKKKTTFVGCLTSLSWVHQFISPDFPNFVRSALLGALLPVASLFSTVCSRNY